MPMLEDMKFTKDDWNVIEQHIESTQQNVEVIRSDDSFAIRIPSNSNGSNPKTKGIICFKSPESGKILIEDSLIQNHLPLLKQVLLDEHSDPLIKAASTIINSIKPTPKILRRLGVF